MNQLSIRFDTVVDTNSILIVSNTDQQYCSNIYWTNIVVYIQKKIQK